MFHLRLELIYYLSYAVMYPENSKIASKRAKQLLKNEEFWKENNFYSFFFLAAEGAFKYCTNENIVKCLFRKISKVLPKTIEI